MRLPPAFVLLLLLVPVGAATHPVERDLVDEVHNAASIVMVVEARGGATGSGAGTERYPSSLEEVTYDYGWTYGWGGTIELRLTADGKLRGDAQLAGAGRGELHETTHTTLYDYEGEVSNEYGARRDCTPERDLASGPSGARRGAYGSLDAETGMLLVLVPGFSLPETPKQDCVFTGDNGQTETTSIYPFPAMSPFVGEGLGLFATRRAAFQEMYAGLDELNAAHSLIFEVPLQMGHTTLVGRATTAFPVEDGPASYSCPRPMEQAITRGSCAATGTLDVRMIVDPCPVARESRDKHLTDLRAVTRPPNGSSEAAARAFQVDVRQKITALLADERVLQLLCGDEDSGGTLKEVAEAIKKVVATWDDVARTHGLSNEGKRDLLSAERAHQLTGGEGVSTTVSDVISQPPGEHGAIRASVHSPVALHAWAPDGRHVGWNATTESVDLQIEGATYDGAPNGAQTITLPSDVYKITVEELSEGDYTLHLSWNGTAGEGVDLLPLRAKAGRTFAMNAMLDHDGMFLGPAQRVATAATPEFAFVQPWAPLPGDGEFAGAPRGASSGVVDAAEAGERGAPAPGLVGLAFALVGAALLARRVR